MGSVAVGAAEEVPMTLDARCAARSQAFYLFVTACGAFKVELGIPHDNAMMIVIEWRSRFPKVVSVSN